MLRVDRRKHFTQSQYMYVDRAFFDKDMIAPDTIEQLRACEHPIRVTDQEFEELEFSQAPF